MLAQAMVLYLEGLERICLLMRFEDRGSMEFVYEQKVGLMDVLKDNISNYYQGRKLSLIYTICLYILRPSSGQISYLPHSSAQLLCLS